MKLARNLNMLDVFCICSGAMLSGLFLLPGLAYAKAGPSVLVSYLIGGLLASTGLFSQAELASAMPRAGGTYFYVTRSMGSGIGTVYGLITWLSLSLKSAYELVFIASIMAIALNLPSFWVRAVACALCMTLLLINLVGVKEAGRLQAVLVFALLAALLLFVGRGLPRVDVHAFQPFAPLGLGATASTAAFVFVSFGGLLKVASITEEIKDPGRHLSAGMLISLVCVLLFYLATLFVTLGVLGPGLAGSRNPIGEAAGVFLGSAGRAGFTLAAVLAVVSAANAGIMSASRYPLALARDRMLPRGFGAINKRFKTPHVAILLTGVIILAALSLNTVLLVKAASGVLILTYLFSCLTVVIMRESRLQNYRPTFRSPLYPWLQGCGVLGFLFFLAELGGGRVMAVTLLISAGLFLYWCFGRVSATREFALLHLIERITAKELTSHSLEAELKEIIRERDDLLKDRFDHVIEECPVLDIPESVPMEEFFRLAARKMGPRLGLDPVSLFRRFLEREKESSTVLSPFLAIPHIILEGEGKFDILLARSRQGIVFSDDAPAVHTVFLLLGTKDERHFHLRSLAAIAQVAQDPHFEEKWMAARSEEALRDVVLLGRRQRHPRGETGSSRGGHP